MCQRAWLVCEYLLGGNNVGRVFHVVVLLLHQTCDASPGSSALARLCEQQKPLENGSFPRYSGMMRDVQR